MNKTILITGSTDGIGKLAAIKLAKDGHEIYLHGRNEEKLNKVIAEVKNLSGNDNIGGFIADFSDLSAVQTMASTIADQLSKIDVLINNAGVYKNNISASKNGIDTRFVVNYFAPYLLTEKLLPLLEKGNGPRLINLSSAAQAAVSLDALNGKSEVATHGSYAQSKLALTMWSFYLAKKQPDLTVIAVNPGSLLDTRMVREGFGKVWSSADKGGDILYDLAVGDKHQLMSGKYFDNDQGRYGQAHSDAYDEAKIEQLISATNEIVLKN